jgi:hypothetical protein
MVPNIFNSALPILTDVVVRLLWPIFSCFVNELVSLPLIDSVFKELEIKFVIVTSPEVLGYI